MGIDLSPAPMKNVSIAAALETLTAQPIGSPGTTHRFAATSPPPYATFKSSRLATRIDAAGPRRFTLGAALKRGRLSLDSLLSYSAVCGTA